LQAKEKTKNVNKGGKERRREEKEREENKRGLERQKHIGCNHSFLKRSCHAICYNLKTFFVSNEFQIWSVFTHVASIYANLLEQKSVYIRKELNSLTIDLGHQHDRRDVI